MTTRLIDGIIVGGVVALVVVGAVDALRSSGGEAAPPVGTSPAGTAPTTIEQLPSPLVRCLRRDTTVSIEVRGDRRHRRVATLVARYVGSGHCTQPYLPFTLTVRDSAGTRLGEWFGLTNGGDVSAGTEWTFALPDVWRCDRSGPYIAVADVGPYAARRSNLSRSAITC